VVHIKLNEKKGTNITNYTWPYSLLTRLSEGRGLSDRSGNFGHTRLGDTGAANLQKASELSSSATENLMRPVAMLVKQVASRVQPHFYVLKK
jgi:hypothetical protein